MQEATRKSVDFIMAKIKERKNITNKICEASWEDENYDLKVRLDLEKNELEFLVYYHIKIARNNLLDAVLAVAYLNDLIWNSWRKNIVYVCDINKRKVGVKRKIFIEPSLTSTVSLKHQIFTLKRACESFEKDLATLLETGNVNSFKRNTYYYSGDIRYSDEGLRIRHAQKACEKFGLFVTSHHGLTAYKWKLKGKTPESGRTIPMLLKGDMEGELIALTHPLPCGFELERGADVMMAIAHLNNKMEYGLFNVDFYKGQIKGQVTYRIIVDSDKATFSAGRYEEIFDSVTQTLSKYYPILVDYIKGNINERKFMDEMEAN